VAPGSGHCGRNTSAKVACPGAPAPGRARNRAPRPTDGFGDRRRARPSGRRRPPGRRGGWVGGRTQVSALCSHRRPTVYGPMPRGHGDASDSQDRSRGRDHRRRRGSGSGDRCRRRWWSRGRRWVTDRIRNRGRLRHGLRPRRRRGRRALRRQEGERIEVALRIGRAAHSEVDVRHRQLRLAARADRADELALRDCVAAPDRVRPEVNERDRVAVRRRDRQRLAADRHGPREGDGARDRRLHPRTARRPDVDSAVLPGGVRVLAVEREERQHRAVHGPAPAQGGRGDDQHRDGSHRRWEQAHLGTTSVVRYANAEPR
jgi:hypothetical protein